MRFLGKHLLFHCERVSLWVSPWFLGGEVCEVIHNAVQNPQHPLPHPVHPRPSGRGLWLRGRSLHGAFWKYNKGKMLLSMVVVCKNPPVKILSKHAIHINHPSKMPGFSVLISNSSTCCIKHVLRSVSFNPFLPSLATALLACWTETAANNWRKLIVWVQKTITCLVEHVMFSNLGNKWTIG